MIHCQESFDIPDSFTTTIPPFASLTFSQIVLGQYYPVTPGTYNINFSYLAIPANAFNQNITIEADTIIFGKENSYYDLILNHYVGPRLIQVPQ
ncbi:MAG: hypothetical protein JW969_13720 [Spirochaetales bacterium]|nr:hypothetical protein [Spirochaetales bacterium]